jgi:hypothetical protein
VEMAIRDESSNRDIYISSEILRYRRVQQISDYLRIKARHRVSGIGAIAGRRSRIGQRWHSMSGMSRMTLIIAIGTVIGTLAAVATLFLTVS